VPVQKLVFIFKATLISLVSQEKLKNTVSYLQLLEFRSLPADILIYLTSEFRAEGMGSNPIMHGESNWLK